jgi:hypothetical protein
MSHTTDVISTDSTVVMATTAEGPPTIYPKLVKENFLAIRQMMNYYVREERNKGVRVQLSFDDEIQTTANTDIPPFPFPTTVPTSIPNVNASSTSKSDRRLTPL